MSTTQSAGIDELVQGAAALVPALRERRTETEELRRLPDATVSEIRELGVLGIACPQELGGLGIGPDGILEVAMELGRGCGATGWTAGNWAIHNMLGPMFGPEARQELYGSGTMPIISTGFSPLRATTTPVDGGAVISGQWDFASGVDHSEYVVVMAIGEQGPLAHLVPTSQLEIVDTWHTAGLRGTGSNDVAASELFVPEHRLLWMAGPGEGQSIGRELYAMPWFRLPLGSVFGCAVVGSILGMAQGALEVFVERTAEKVGGLSGIQVGTRPDVHSRIGEAAADLDAAVAFVRASYAEMRAVAESDQSYSMQDRVRWRRDAAWGAREALAAVNLVFEVGGAHVLWLDDQLHQFHRDITAATHHYGMAWSQLFAGYGRAALGLDPQVAMV
jgi:3-hydroxy-9,10-secoandrosta-1,3,5(10)-triene-9,17-dione monooxygenase